MNKTTSGLFFLLVFLLSNCNKKETEVVEEFVKPNIVWIVLEDQSPDFFPMYGDSTAHLPNLEKLSDHSTIYTNAYAPAPVCSPTRGSIITGVYPTSLGTHNMRCYNAYNTDNQPEINIPSYSPVVSEGVQPFTHYLRSEGYYCTNNAKEDYNFATLPSTWDDSGKDATWKNRNSGQPFFAIFNIEVTHESRIWQNGEKELFVDPAIINVPPYFPNDSITRHDMAVNYSNLIRADIQIGEILEQLKADSLYDETIIFFYTDHGGPFPRHKRALYETGTKVPFMVKLPNQEMQKTISELINFIDFAPTMLSLASIPTPDFMQGKAFLGAYKSDEKSQYIFTASDRFDESYDRIRAVRNNKYKYIKNFNMDVPYALSIAYRRNMPMMQNLIRLKEIGLLNEDQLKWMSDTKPKEELYDLEKDPFELKNLANDSLWNEIKGELSNVLMEWMESTNDLGRQKERDLIDNWLIDGHQPILPTPDLKMIEGRYLEIISSKTDATNIWRNRGDSAWSIYSKPIEITEKMNLEIKTVRIGFEDSKIISFEN